MLELRKLSPALQAKTKKDFNETDDLIRESIAALREWLAKQPHINARTDEQSLLNFLRAGKYSIEKTKKKIDNYYTARTQLPQYFKNRDIHSPRAHEIIRKGYIVFLPHAEGDDGPRPTMCRMGCFDTNEYSPQQMMSTISLMSDLSIFFDDHTLVSGYKVVIDAAGLTMSHLLQYDPIFTKQLVYFIQEALPGRIIGIYTINANSLVEKFLNMVKALMTSKLSSRIQILSNIQSLYEYVPQKLLPKEYGGEAGTIEEIGNGWIEKLRQNEALIKEEDMYGVDESKRTSGAKGISDLFGAEGSFRTLNLD